MARHGRIKCRFIDAIAPLAANVCRQIQRETIGIVQLECRLAIQYTAFGQTCQCAVQDFHTVSNRLEEALFFQTQNIGNALFGAGQFRIGLTHLGHQRCNQRVEERRPGAQFVPMANRPTDDPAQHIATPFVARNHTIHNQEGAGTDVIGNHFQ